jgi:hypothetical protein
MNGVGGDGDYKGTKWAIKKGLGNEERTVGTLLKTKMAMN